MAKLKEGEKVVQKFEVTTKFEAIDGDKKITPDEITAVLDGLSTISGNGVEVKVKKVRESAE